MTTQVGAVRRDYRAPRSLSDPRPLGRGLLRTLTALCFLAPALTILILFVASPMLAALRTSFFSSSGFGPETFVGGANYARIFQDPLLVKAMGNTAIYAALFTPVAVVVALLVALVVADERLPFRGLLRSALFLPFIVSLAVAAFAWGFLLDPQLGLLNYWLRGLGIRLGNVLQDPVLAMPTVVLVAVWKSFGFYMVVFVAGLQDIPRSLYEAARVDGAGALRRFRSVTLPLLNNTLTFVVIFALIAALQAFDQIYVLTQGGPLHATDTVVTEIYQSGFKELDLGIASALSYVLLGATLLLSLIQFALGSRREKDLAS
ncbi:MAG: sugar ABC transporter permease [Micrococcales bacterium]|nr:sugar ABC transporter permease [Micrococcales bacterium]